MVEDLWAKQAGRSHTLRIYCSIPKIRRIIALRTSFVIAPYCGTRYFITVGKHVYELF